MNFVVDNMYVWAEQEISARHNSTSGWSSSEPLQLEWVAPMQRRRLSPFARLALHSAHQVAGGVSDSSVCVFSSRHGDLHKTALLLDNVANEEDMSPTAFGLSVHNAVAGLFSILTGNKQAACAIAAGSDTFLMGLIDALARCQVQQGPVLLVHCDRRLPDEYLTFSDEPQCEHAVALLVRPAKAGEAYFSLSSEQDDAVIKQDWLPASLNLAHALYHKEGCTLKGQQGCWRLSYHAAA